MKKIAKGILCLLTTLVIASCGNINQPTNNNEENIPLEASIENFKSIIGKVDLSVQIKKGFHLGETNNTSKKSRSNRINNPIDSEEYPDESEYIKYETKNQQDYNVYVYVLYLEEAIKYYISTYKTLSKRIIQSADDLGDFKMRDTTYELSMSDDGVCLITFVDSTASVFYENNDTPIASVEGSTTYFYFTENEYEIYEKYNGLEYYKDEYEDLGLDFFDTYYHVKMEDNDNYTLVEGREYDPFSLCIENFRMFKVGEKVIYECFDLFLDGYNCSIDLVTFVNTTSFALSAFGFVGQENTYNEETYDEDTYDEETFDTFDYRSALFRDNRKYCWSIQINQGTCDGIWIFPTIGTDCMSMLRMNGFQYSLYAKDWCGKEVFNGCLGYYSEYFKTDLGMFKTSEVAEVYDIHNIDSLLCPSSTGVIYPGREIICAGYSKEELESDKCLKDIWNDKLSVVGLSLNPDDVDFYNIVSTYSRKDFFTYEKLDEWSDKETFDAWNNMNSREEYLAKVTIKNFAWMLPEEAETPTE